MSHNPNSSRSGTRAVVVDLVVAAMIFGAGTLVCWDSYRIGSTWGADGPQSGYFPFYIGLIACVCGAVVFVQNLRRLGTDKSVFVTADRFKLVLVILLPSTFYVLGVQFLGIYVSSAVFIALFMRIAGRYSWLRSAVVGLGVSISSFVMFEIWFNIPLPKGPLESLLGY